jgi:hypothetical protein
MKINLRIGHMFLPDQFMHSGSLQSLSRTDEEQVREVGVWSAPKFQLRLQLRSDEANDTAFDPLLFCIEDI